MHGNHQLHCECSIRVYSVALQQFEWLSHSIICNTKESRKVTKSTMKIPYKWKGYTVLSRI